MTAPAVVDVQAHIFPPRYLQALRRVADGGGRAAAIARRALEDPLTSRDPIFTGDLGQRLEMMDAAGVDMHVLSFAAPNVWSDDAAERVRVCRAFNDGVADIVREHPGRFALLATLPLPYVDESIEEARRALDELGAVGVGLCTHFDGTPIDDERFDPLYEYLSQREVPVTVHPEGFFVPGALADFGMEWAIGTPFDDTVVALRLIYSGVLDRHPGIRWIIPHLGGTLPFLAQRLDFIWRLNPQVNALLPEPPTTYLRRMYFDTVNPDARAVALGVDVLGTDRLLYASDFPFASRKDLAFGLGLLAEAGLDGTQRAAVAGATAAGVLGLDG